MRGLAAGSIVAVLSLGAAAQASCTSFRGEDGTPSPEGGVDGSTAEAGTELPRERDIEVSIDWPSVATLDPSTRPNAGEMTLVLTDVADKTRSASKKVQAAERGPFLFSKFQSSSAIDVVLEIRSAAALLLGYGERRRSDVAATPKVTVAARRRLLYVASRDRGPSEVGTLRTLDLAPPMLPEPSVAEASDAPALDLVPMAMALYVTDDGLRLVEAGGPDNAPGTVGVFMTGTHAKEKVIPLPFAPAVMAPIGDGHKALVFPQATSGISYAAIVDIDAGTASTIQTGITAGTVDAWSIAVHPSSPKIFVAGDLRAGAVRAAYVFVFDGGTITPIKITALTAVRGVRFLPAGNLAIVAGFVTNGGSSEARVVTLDPNALSDEAKPLFSTQMWEPVAMTLNRDGKFAHVSGGNCCFDLITVNLRTGQAREKYVSDGFGPRYELVSALELPYEPHRILAGQTDAANNGRSTLVEVVGGGVGPTDVNLANNASFGSFHAMASPFARAR